MVIDRSYRFVSGKAGAAERTAPDQRAPIPFRALSLDLEVCVQDSRIRALAGVRSNSARSFIHSSGKGLAGALNDLDALADGADFLLGHNLVAFDLPHLRAVDPALRLLRLPAVDTLMLNPLAFPRNPYHHLVKHYQDGQLNRGRVNDPELDARLALDVFRNQLTAFRDAPPDLLTAWHWLTTREKGAGFDMVFSHVRGSPTPSDDEARDAIRALLDGKSCRTRARAIIADAHRHGWELAYVLAWLSVSGGNSVMPPWVRHQFPEAGRMVRRLRNYACSDPGCDWCRERHDARKELKHWFGFDDFRAEPADESGTPMQRSIIESAMAGENVLGILPTGAGKSLCYQIPALSRYDKTGALTVVISPLVALMQDQVSGLHKRGIESCVTINGMLSMPERSDALDKVRLGDAGILIISPEQLRSVSVRRVLEQREIGCWVLDEAHCLSKWGHDFRPDYRYVGRFIRERWEKSDDEAPPPVTCLTATAKPDVMAEIVDYFKKELDVNLKVFNGGAQRSNLEFVVVRTSGEEKSAHIHQMLEADLPADDRSGAIVYCSTRRHSEEVAEFLREKGMEVGHFHAGLSPEVKKDVQQSFIGGDLRVIVATNAFGMGIDKPDVRLVIHADIPGSLENYLQEAGRAGRDQQAARCVLLYTQNDVERQFGMSARSRLTQREIHGVLRALRNMDRKNRRNRKKEQEGEIIATAGEILSEDEDKAFERDSATDDTRVRTALSWLEESELLSREENRVQVFPSSLRVASIGEARARLARHRITDPYRGQLLRIVAALINAPPDEGISTDDLMAASGLTAEGVRGALHDMETFGLASNDTVLTAFVHIGVQRHSRRRFEQAEALEIALIDLLRETSPDMGKDDTSTLHLRLAAQSLKDEGHSYALPERLRRIVRSIAADGRGEGGGGSLGVRGSDTETMQLTLQREWKDLDKIAAQRRTAARLLLNHLLGKLPPGSRGTDLLSETTMGNLLNAVKSDQILSSEVRHPNKLMDRALLWLHEQEVIRLNKGLTVLRPAMTIRLRRERRGFARADFAPLDIHYKEQVLQIHVMAEYVQKGLGTMADAIRMAMDYFSLLRDEFLRRWLPDRERELSRQTTPESWRSIVEILNNPTQRRIVADERERTNVLVLAGPGSGKTKALVHRLAYLIRARRENPRAILALAYNRHAAIEIRRRLADLVGDDARGVITLTCHALAMRLVGASFSSRANHPDDGDFREILRQATAMLRGEGLPPDEADEYRARLLRGFRWILVDEYQDIGPDQYELISALAGRTIPEEDDRLSLFAVGDDDQNIYAFNGSSVKFIRQFEEDYGAKPVFLTDNYRSTKNIIDAANAVIEPARHRMKADNPIHVNRSRANDLLGGEWAELDPVVRGRVQILPAGDSPITQAQTAIAELKRLSQLTSDWDWSKCAVIAREWRYLDPVRSLCELEGIPAQMANEDFSGFWHLRETRALVKWVNGRDSALLTAADASAWLDRQRSNVWVETLRDAVADYALETGGAETTTDAFIEWLAEWGREARRKQRGLLLTTAHRGKGLEFDHAVVLDGGWDRVGRGEDADAPRRLYYVAMTRARHTLTLARLPGPHPIQDALSGRRPELHRRQPLDLPPAPPDLARLYRSLSLRDVFLSFAGRYLSPDHPAHRAIAALAPGDPLEIRVRANRWEILDSNGMVVGRLAGNFEPPAGMRCRSAEVLAIAEWSRDKSEPEYQANLRCDTWEIVIPELVFEPSR